MVMAMNAMLMAMMTFVRRSDRSDQRTSVSQKKNKPLTRHTTPREFFEVAGPTYIASPVHSEYCLPRRGKYLISKMESGINRKESRRSVVRTASKGSASDNTT